MGSASVEDDANRLGECLWCGAAFKPTKTGSPRRFCSPQHRHEFHSASRLWAEQALSSGRLTVEELKNAPTTKACTASVGTEAAQEGPGSPSRRNRLAREPNVDLSSQNRRRYHS